MGRTSTEIADLTALPAFDWSDLATQAETNKEMLDSLATDPDRVLALLANARTDPALAAMAEKDDFRYKVVLYASDHQRFRLRFHLWKVGFQDCVHAHRFCYTARLLNGGYEHTLWDIGGQQLYPEGVKDRVEQQIELSDPLVTNNVDVGAFSPSMVMRVQSGDCYTQHNSILSSTVTFPDTASLFLRGPAERDVAFQWYPEDNYVMWRGGRHVVPQKAAAEVTMTPDDFDFVKERLSAILA